MKISEIMRISQNGYIDSPEEVGHLTDTLAATRMGDLLAPCKEDCALTALPIVYDIPYTHIESMSYLKAAVLICNLDKGMQRVSRSLEGHVEPDQFKRLQTAMLYRALDEAAKTNLTVKRFFGINVCSLFECLERRHNDHKLIQIYGALTKTWSGLQGTVDQRKSPKDMNVGTMLKELNEICNRSWKCWSDDTAYTQSIIDANNLMSMIIIDSFLVGYRENATMKGLIYR